MELTKRTDSHLFAALNGWTFVASAADIMTTVHAQAFLNVHRDEGQPLVLFPQPWDPPVVAETVTADEYVELRASLERRSAFRDL